MSDPTTTVEEEMERLGRDGRLVAEALYHLCKLRDAGYIEGGNIKMTDAGMRLGKAIADTKEFTQDELNAVSVLVMRETGGIGKSEEETT